MDESVAATVTTPHSSSGVPHEGVSVSSPLETRRPSIVIEVPTTTTTTTTAVAFPSGLSLSCLKDRTMSKRNSDDSLSLEDLVRQVLKSSTQERRARRRRREEQQLDKRIHKHMEQGKGKEYHRGCAIGNSSSSTTTMMNSSLLESTCSDTSVRDYKCRTTTPGQDNTEPEERRAVSFSTAEYREYNVTLALNSRIRYGLTLDWGYNNMSKIHNLGSSQDSDTTLAGVNEKSPIKVLSIRQRQQRLKTMGISQSRLMAMERRRRIQATMEWAFGNNTDIRPNFANGKILDYCIH